MPRAEYIKANYTLTQDAVGTWIGRSWFEGRCVSMFADASKSLVVDHCRRHWGHFNYQDEAEAFGEIFR